MDEEKDPILRLFLGPVSYTHLDVYKRQALYYVSISSLNGRYESNVDKVSRIISQICLLFSDLDHSHLRGNQHGDT